MYGCPDPDWLALEGRSARVTVVWSLWFGANDDLVFLLHLPIAAVPGGRAAKTGPQGVLGSLQANLPNHRSHAVAAYRPPGRGRGRAVKSRQNMEDFT